jgi:hypothetical protein
VAFSDTLVGDGCSFLKALSLVSQNPKPNYKILTLPVCVGVASFFLMPQCPAKTKSWWNKKGYFTEKEEKIIVNSGPSPTSFHCWLLLTSSVIRDDPQKGGMYNRQGLSVRQIWECAKDYDMWPLYALGLLFGLPKYPVDQYLTLAFRGLGRDPNNST